MNNLILIDKEQLDKMLSEIAQNLYQKYIICHPNTHINHYFPEGKASFTDFYDILTQIIPQPPDVYDGITGSRTIESNQTVTFQAPVGQAFTQLTVEVKVPVLKEEASVGLIPQLWDNNGMITSILLKGMTQIPDSFLSCFSSSFAKEIEIIQFTPQLKKIGNNCFSYCEKLKTINLKDTTELEEIGNYAFYNCSELSEIVIECSRLQKIGDYSFAQQGEAKDRTYYLNGLQKAGDTIGLSCQFGYNVFDNITPESKIIFPSEAIALEAKSETNLNVYINNFYYFSSSDAEIKKLVVSS